MATLGGGIISGGDGDNHVKYTDAEAVAAVHTKYADSEAIAAVEGEATLDLAGDVDVATGKTLSADGLQFPATQVASADVNGLDDYEEGTFTPQVADNNLDGTGEGQVYATQVGRYTKIGNRVYFNLSIGTSDIGTLTTTEIIHILGLPFVTNATSNNRHTQPVSAGTGLSITAGNCIVGRIEANTSFVRFDEWDATTGITNVVLSAWTDDGSIALSGMYEV